MFRSQPQIRKYLGDITLGPQPKGWIKRHKELGDKKLLRLWLEGQVRYGKWVKERNKPDHYLIYAIMFEIVGRPTILIKIERFRTFVQINHTHKLRQKK